MKTVVVYKTKYGSTEKYGKWIAEDLECDIFKAQDIKIEDLIKYDSIVYCGGLYAGGILGFSIIKNNFEKIKDKKIAVVAVGATLKNENAIEEVKNGNLTPEMVNKVELFLLRGGLNYKEMGILDRFLMYLMVKSIKRKNENELDNDSKGILATYGKTVDFTKRDTIVPVINFMKNV